MKLLNPRAIVLHFFEGEDPMRMLIGAMSLILLAGCVSSAMNDARSKSPTRVLTSAKEAPLVAECIKFSWEDESVFGVDASAYVNNDKTRPTEGQAWFGETLDLRQMSEVQIAQAGIGRKFQKPTVFEALSVFENLELAQKTDKSVWASLRAKLSGEQKDRIGEVLHTIRLSGSAHRPAGLLSHGQKQFLEIGMLLMQDPQLLLLDEPVAGMTDAETEFTAELFKRLAGKHSLMVVEHDMGFVGSIADHVTVLHQGSVLAEGSLEQVQADERVIEVYLGR